MSSNIEIKRLCQYCGIEFIARTTKTRYCSHICNGRAYKAQLKTAKVDSSNIETKRIKNRPIDELKAKEFLSVQDACKLLGISHRTIYRLLQRGELKAGKIGKRTIFKRSEIDKLFELPIQIQQVQESIPETIYFDESDYYRLKDVQLKYSISEKALYELIKRENILKFRKGIYSLVPKMEIDKLFA